MLAHNERGPEEADHRHRWLLRARRDWPRRCRAAEERDELAPFHCQMPPVLLAERIAHLGFGGQETAALRNFSPAYVRVGSCVTSIARPNGGAQLYER